jgi:glutamate synthase (NADPH/NADH) large chain/glutamate synthase (ferredoxin)
MVSLEKVVPATEQKALAVQTKLHGNLTDEALLKRLLEDHNRWTGSKRARDLLDNWAESRQKFVKVFPNEYKRALAEMHEREVAEASTGNNSQAAVHDGIAAA